MTNAVNKVGVDDLAADLQRLGVRAGDTLFVHSSFRSIGPVEGGAGAVIAAMERVIGPNGLLLMPSFNLVDGDRAGTWDLAHSPATTGYLCEYFRTMPGTYRSDHYSHSVAARGKGAAEFVAGHRDREGMISPWDLEPWGRTYGTHSPLIRAYAANGKILMLGVDYHSSTYLHVVEVMWWNRRLAQNPSAKYNYVHREALGAKWDEIGWISRDKIGAADSRLFSIREFVDTMLAFASANPRQACKWWEE
ncbi:MAG: AAC(3) family N-acetyltransferase [Phycisphaeraceae bacterium]|nr:AAC(3) family N-acetyltransferase [Phycisphaeraceae bacterium]